MPWVGVIRSFDSAEDVRLAVGSSHYISGSPVVASLEQEIAKQFGVDGVALTNCGLGAIQSAVDYFLGDSSVNKKVLCSYFVYSGSMTLMQNLKTRGVCLRYFNPSNLDKLKELVQSSRFSLCLLETIGNAPTMPVADMLAIMDILDSAGVAVIIDTTTTPNFNPFAFKGVYGVDLAVVASLSKWYVWNSVVAGGMALGSKEFVDGVKSSVTYRTNCMQPLVAERISWSRAKLYYALFCKNAMAMARVLDSSPKVEAVFYPGLPDHPQNDLVYKYFSGLAGGILYIILGSQAIADKFVNLLNKFPCVATAPSFGDVEQVRVWPSFKAGQNQDKPVFVRLASSAHTGQKAEDFLQYLREVLEKI